MTTNEDYAQTPEAKTPLVSPGTYSPVTVTVKDTIGAFFLGILTVILLIGWMRSEKRYHALVTQPKVNDGNRSLHAE